MCRRIWAGFRRIWETREGRGQVGGILLFGDKALLVRQASSSHNLWVCVWLSTQMWKKKQIERRWHCLIDFRSHTIPCWEQERTRRSLDLLWWIPTYLLGRVGQEGTLHWWREGKVGENCCWFLNFVSNLFVGHVQMAVNQQSAQERMCKSKKFYLLPESHPSVPFCFVLMTIEECKINMISCFWKIFRICCDGSSPLLDGNRFAEYFSPLLISRCPYTLVDCAYLMEPFDPGRRPRVPMDQDRNVPKTTAHRITQQQIYSLYMLLASFCIRIF